jgi:chorismate mutase
MKKKEINKSLRTARKKIDEIDEQIIALFGKRFLQIQKIGALKKDKKEISDERRNREIMKTRKAWGLKAGLPAIFINAIYKTLLDFSIKQQNKIWKHLSK